MLRILRRRSTATDTATAPTARVPAVPPTRAVRTAAALDHDRAARRVLWCGRIFIGIISVVMLLLLGRIAQLQREPHPQIAARLAMQSSETPLLARRGPIVDRRGRPLAHTRVASRLFVDPALIEDHGLFSQQVARALGGADAGYDAVDIDRKIAARPDSRYVVIEPRVPDARVYAAEQAAADLKGLSIEQRLVREHPQGAAAAQLIGFTDHEGIGREGLEGRLNDDLLARGGRRPLIRDARRRPLWLAGRGLDPGQDGTPVRLTLDLNLQRLGERLLQDTLDEFNAEAGQLIALDPATGEILCMATRPAFDPAAPRTDPDLWRNRSVTDVFEPGSIMKPIVWAAMLELGLTHPDETFDCTTTGWWKPERGPVLRDAHPHGELSWDEILVVSSNIGMAMVAERMGRPQLHRVFTDFGFGGPTGSNLPGEAGGLLRPLDAWSWTDLTRLPMGQGVAVTPLQMMRGFAPLANGGLLHTPRIRLDGDPPPPPTRVLSPEVADHTRAVLHEVVLRGTGRRANSDTYRLFGKTGTAQLPDPVNGGYLENGYVSSFVAGGPLAHPRLLVGCFIHKPDKSIAHYGGIVAGPPVRDFLDQALAYLGVPPDVTPTHLASTD